VKQIWSDTALADSLDWIDFSIPGIKK
jgi:hypothetical protein